MKQQKNENWWMLSLICIGIHNLKFYANYKKLETRIW